MTPSATCERCSGAGWVWLTAEPPAPPAAVEASCPDCCVPRAHAVADWREANHWSPQLRACRHCGLPTHLRDGNDAPAHKLCVERDAAMASPPPAEAGGGR